MIKSFQVLILLGMLSTTYADSVTQTSWYGSNGHWGPYSSWYYRYSSSGVTGFSSIYLASPKYTVDDDFDGARSVYSADINGDGFMDLLGAARLGGEITWWDNVDGSGERWIEHTIDGDFFDARSVYSADINGDGFMDALGARAQSADEIYWWENVDGSGTVWVEHCVDDYFSYVFSVYSTDVNGDGFADVLGAARSANDITWWENVDGSGASWIEHTIDGAFSGAISVHAGDVNGDGYMDVLGAAAEGDEIAWWQNVNGSGSSWIKHSVDDEIDFASSVYSCDLNGDGYLDILGAEYIGDRISWWQNVDGSGTDWIDHTLDGSVNGPRDVYSTDINGDGYMDVLGAANDGNEIIWWESTDGSGTGWIKHVLDTTIIWASTVYAADLNGEGFLDVIGADYLDKEIVWWDPSKLETEGWLESSCLALGNDPGWGTIDWESTEPPGTFVALQVRSSDSPDSDAMGAWSDTLYSPCSLAGMLEEGDSYFQYRAIFQSSDSTITPFLDEVTLMWDPLGLEEAADAELLLHVSPNPSPGHPVVSFSIPEPGSVELALFDLSGRIIREVGVSEYSEGRHEVQLEDLASGIYFCRLRFGESAETQRFAVIR